MDDSAKDGKTACPNCGKAVDSLRAGAVSIAGGRIIHYCSRTCREAHLRRDGKHAAPSAEPAAEAVEERGFEPGPAVEPAAERPGSAPRPARPRLGSLLVQAIALAAIGVVGVLVAVLPLAWLGGFLVPGLAGLVALVALAASVVGVRRSGPARIIEAAAFPLAAAALVAVGLLTSATRSPCIAAVFLVFVERAGRLLELAGRSRSGVVSVLGGAPPLLLASEWRDNSTIAAQVRRVTLVLEWARYPLAAAVGFGVWLLGDTSLALALIAGATVLVAINTRALRLVTGDAHLSVALAAARRGTVIRDAHAVNRVGATRVILFMAKRVLVAPKVRIVDWQVVDGVDEGAVLAALAGVESQTQGRIAEAVTEFAAAQGVAPRSVDELVVRPGVGLAGQTPHGRLLCGGRMHLLEENVSTGEHEEWAASVEQSGRRALFVALGGRVVAMFAAEEEPVTDAQEVMRGLSSLGLEPAMITTAEVEAAQALGNRLAIENVRFGTGEGRLGAVLAEVTGAGDSVLLVGHGPAFEENLRAATAGFALGSDEPTMAGVDARHQGLDEVLAVVKAARDSRRSVKVNLVAAVAAAMIGVALSTGWHAPAVVVFAGLIGCLASVLSTVNGPYPRLERLLARASRAYGRLLKKLGIKRTAAP